MNDLSSSSGRLTSVLLPASFVLVWSSGYLVGDIGTRVVAPGTLLFWRFALATLALAIITLVTRAPWPTTARSWLHLLVTGALLQTLQFAGVFVAIALGVSAGLTALVVCSTPLVVAVAAVPLFGERLGLLQGFGLVLGVVGVLCAVVAEVSGASNVGGMVAVLIGLGGFVAGTLYQKRFGSAMDLRSGALVQLIGATVTAVPVALFDGGLALPLTAVAVGATTWLAVVNSIGAFALLFLLLRSRPGANATSYLFLVPPVTGLLGVPLLQQAVPLGAVIGILLSAVGVGLVVWGPASRTGPIDGVGAETDSELEKTGD